jgi:hypothetical protein
MSGIIMDNLMNVNASLQIQDYMSENFEFGKNFHQPFTQKLAPNWRQFQYFITFFRNYSFAKCIKKSSGFLRHDL